MWSTEPPPRRSANRGVYSWHGVVDQGGSSLRDSSSAVYSIASPERLWHHEGETNHTGYTPQAFRGGLLMHGRTHACTPAAEAG